MIVAQVRAVVGDIGVDAVKIGMLGDEATIAAVLEALDLIDEATPIVLDPVMVSESGAVLLDRRRPGGADQRSVATGDGCDAEPRRGPGADRDRSLGGPAGARRRGSRARRSGGDRHRWSR